MKLKSACIAANTLSFLLFNSPFIVAEASTPPMDPVTIASLAELSLEELMEVKVITASKTDQSINDAPGIVSVITAKEIQKFGANSLYEVLERIAGTYLPSFFFYAQNAVSMRGDLPEGQDKHTLLLLNGRPFRESMTQGLNTSFYLSLPLLAIDKIEIIRGPGSVLYGTNAFTGVINVITKKDFKFDQPTTVQATATTGSLGTRASEAYIAQQHGDFKWMGSVRYFREDGWNFQAVDIMGVMGHEDYSERDTGAYMYGSRRSDQ
jgi:outer membrane receptor for ferrienterochelin and colicins